jgi:hypothetical protein
MSVWKRRVAGKLVFKFQKPSGVFGSFCIRVINSVFNNAVLTSEVI